jgi:DNA (cytosine-5)-methyltransferase 1
MTGTVIDLYAGPGGWDEGMRNAGITDVVGIEIEANACATAEAAGHKRVQADVSAVPTGDYAGAWGLVASPPCQAWSMAGKRQGELDRAKVHALIDTYASGSDVIGTGWADERSHHAAQPIRWVRDLRPTWVCMEQVPPVLPLWEHTAERLRRWGYSTWTGVLNAADYGVPQTRERAVLMARLAGPAHPPAPTHGKEPEGTDLFGGELLPWVSMADALGWPHGLVGFPRQDDGTGEAITIGGVDYRARDLHPTDGPAQVVTEKSRSWSRWQIAGNTRANAAARNLDEPAPAIFSSRTGNLTWTLRNGTNANACTRDLDEPAGTPFFGGRLNNVSWVLNRPATTVAGDPRIAAPGHRDRAGGERQHEQSIRVSIQEAAVLQSFPADYPWQGTKTAQFLQVGNAVPPKLAEAIVRAVAA